MSAERPALPGLPQRIAQRLRALAAVTVSDPSTVSLVVANLLAIAVARLYGMSLRDLMFVYWLQTVMIGVAQVLRILCLKDFSKAGFTDRNGEPLDTRGLGKISSAILFSVGYGFAHLVLLVFIVNELSEGKLPPPGELLACGLMFAGHQIFSTARKIKLDRLGRPRIHAMMGAPFTRIWPMHAVFLVGGLSFARDSSVPWWLFISLKTVIDVVMHVREERMLREALAEKVLERSRPGRL